MKSAKSKRQLTILTLILALGVAVYLNWEYAKTDSSFVLPTQTQAEEDALLANAQAEDVPVMEALPDKNYGEAQLVSVSENSSDQYFETARLTRTKTRDEALDKLAAKPEGHRPYGRGKGTAEGYTFQHHLQHFAGKRY